jgi:AcrR family transcriptional regulator
MTEPMKTDRRVRRTRELLRQALVSLILERGYEHISVQDILDRADIGRSTFYAHYRDKDQLLLSGFDEAFAALAAEIPPPDPNGGRPADFLDPARVLFAHAEGHRQLWKALVGKPGAELVLRFLSDNLTALLEPHLRAQLPDGHPDELKLAPAVQYTVNGLIGILVWWCEHDVPYTAAETYTVFKRLTTQGVKRFLATNEPDRMPTTLA